jgi:hypothetical protein
LMYSALLLDVSLLLYYDTCIVQEKKFHISRQSLSAVNRIKLWICSISALLKEVGRLFVKLLIDAGWLSLATLFFQILFMEGIILEILTEF